MQLKNSEILIAWLEPRKRNVPMREGKGIQPQPATAMRGAPFPPLRGRDTADTSQQIWKCRPQSAWSAHTVSELYEVYLTNEVVGKKRSEKEFDRVFRKYIQPELGDRIADTLTRGDVSRFVEKIAFERGKETLTMARIAYRHLSTFYTWATPKLENLPAHRCRDAWRPKAGEPRDRVLSDRELVALWQAAIVDGFPFGHLVQMLILTAQRRGEVLDAICDEFDFKGKVWTVPGERAKNGRANVVPLSS